MRPAMMLLVLAPLAACTEANLVYPASDLQARQEAACVTAVAAHIRQPESVLTPRWLSSQDGIAQVETLDGNRRHLCQVNASAQVLAVTHPGR